MLLFSYLKKRGLVFFNQDELSKKIFHNSARNLIIRVGAILLNIALVPLLLKIIGNESYGTFLTWFSIISWLNYFDFGISNSLKNKLTGYLALGKNQEAQVLLSSTYFFLFCIMIGVNIVFGLLFSIGVFDFFFDKASFELFRFSFLLFSIQFVLQPVNTYLFSIHKSFVTSLCTFLSNLVIFLICLIVLKLNFKLDWYVLLNLNIIVPIGMLVVLSFYGYYVKKGGVRPSFKGVDITKFTEVFQSGIFFIIIQIGVLVLFQTDNIIISKILGNMFVTEFNVVHKLFSVFTMLFIIIVTPFWVGFAEANARKDYTWMLDKLKILRKLGLVFVLFLLPLVFVFSEFLLKLWVGEKVIVSSGTTLGMFIYSISFIYLNYGCYFLNGVNRIKLQAIMYLVIATLNIPLCIYFGKHFGLIGIISTNAVLMLFMAIVLNFEIDNFFKAVLIHKK